MKYTFRKIKGGINSVNNCSALGVSAGIKKSGKKDLALILFDEGVLAEGVFTKNEISAAPVKVAGKKTAQGIKKAIIINSGNANACTGKEGMIAVKKIESYASEKLSVPESSVLSSSTGIIGVQMPVQKMKKGIDKLLAKAKEKNFTGAAEAIMTTDTFPKEYCIEVVSGGERLFRVAGMAKGAGMISPDMATMLAFFVTDIPLERAYLKKVLKECAGETFNCISVDGDMSTNDSVFCFAPSLKKKNSQEKHLKEAFREALMLCMDALARMIVTDGEGATKFVEIKIRGAKSKRDALRAASKIANSMLFKCALFGRDPNWGRIVAAAGASGARIKEEKVDITFGKLKAVKGGKLLSGAERKLKEYFKRKNMEITVDFNLGKESAKIYTCDLSIDYVKINAEYN